jgi:hypothetical protein
MFSWLSILESGSLLPKVHQQADKSRAFIKPYRTHLLREFGESGG